MTQGIYGADIINTVSETYAQEITTPSYGEGLDTLLRDRANQLRGILNGIDDQRFDPATDPDIAANYSADSLQGKTACKAALQQEVGFDLNPRTPLVGLIGRLVEQKGFDLVAEILEPLTAEVDLQVVILGTGEPKYHDLVRELAAHNRRQIAVYLTFDEALAQRIYAGCDMFLMPSRFEPCGLGQMIALRYGTVPIVRSTGGLADTVMDYQPMTGRGTGFVFRRYDATALTFALGRAFEVYRQPEEWRSLQHQGMMQDFSWNASAKKYVDMYHEAQAIHGTGR
jgi:starch synthase